MNNGPMILRRGNTGRNFAIYLTLLLITVCGTANAQNATLAQAVRAFEEELDFEKAEELLTQIVRDDGVSRGDKMKAYQYLARTQLALQKEEDMKSSLVRLVELEPPEAEFRVEAVNSQLMTAYWRVQADVQENLQVHRADGQIHTIAVMDFRNGSFGDDPEKYALLSEHLAGKMTHFLRGAVELKVIERERMAFILGELDLQREGNIVDQATAVQVGKVIGAQSMVFGNFAVFNDNIDILARMVNVETSEILIGETVTGDIDDVFDLTKELTLKIAKEINVELDSKAIDESGESRDIGAMLAYQEGVRFLVQGDEQAASRMFQESLRQDPEYELPALRLTALQHTLN